MTIGTCDYDPPESTIYLSGAVNDGLRRFAHRPDVGVLVQPGTKSYLNEVADFGLWAMDNGCFAEMSGKPFDVETWWSIVQTIPTRGCLFVVAPDVVGDPIATWERSAPWLPRIQEAGLPAALVAQDGIEDTDIQWDAFDTLFIGGSTEWKLSQTVLDLIAEAQRQGKWTHAGRVNSKIRFDHFADPIDHFVDTADGTFLGFGPTANLPRLASWLVQCECCPTPAELRAELKAAA